MTYKIPAGIPNTTVQFTEGFKILDDGAAGDHYFTYKDRTGAVFETVENQIAPNLWSYESPVDLKAYAVLGINDDNVVVAKNFTVKSITFEGKVETQTVSQTTTLVWKTSSGTIQTKNFVSMSGIHKRTLSN
jgi:hypothetical protein